ncbi:MAG: ABC transporter permease [Dokdonella sp.]
MNTLTLPASTKPAIGTIYRREAWYEFLRMLRTPSFALPTLIFPGTFYLMFGVLLAGRSGSAEVSRYMLATYGVFGVMAPALFGIGVSLAIDRERGFLTLKRVLPMPAGAYLFAKLAMAMLFGMIVALMIMVLAATFGAVDLHASQWAMLLLVDTIGTLPFCALGLWIGSLLSGQAAPAVVNLVYLPMAFLSGLWLPLKMLPAAIGMLAPLWPSYHLAQLALKVVGQSAGGSTLVHVGALLAMTAFFYALAWRRLSRPT